ncbi:hypothetical protein CP532_6545 [Ophiocordyceps camponoti-leonardi (nom. inval.)]|nr:hypothetical protein CP532_6545 [Ophiocordyceps camponoti-leonardi (nom. inval.)]
MAESEESGKRLVCLEGIDVSTQAPAASATGEELRPLLHQMLSEALTLLDSMPTGSKASDQGSRWKSKGIKTFAHSISPVQLFERTVTIEGGGGGGGKRRRGKTTSETWAMRRSVHEDKAAAGTASWQEWERHIKREHASSERDFTPTVESTRLLRSWDCSSVLRLEAAGGGGGGGGPWSDWTLKLEESVHRLPFPLRRRVFPVLQVTAGRGGDEVGKRDFVVVQVAATKTKNRREEGVEGEEDDDDDDDVVGGAYTSVERVRDTDEGIEWLMGTVSDAGGVVPAWVQRMAVPGQVAKDVDLFLGQTMSQPRRQRSVPPPLRSKGVVTNGSVMALSSASTVTSSPSVLVAPPPTTTTDASLQGQAEALARMTVELNLRAVSVQAERLEKELKELVALTSEDRAFRSRNEERVADVWREVVAVKTQMANFARQNRHPREGGEEEEGEEDGGNGGADHDVQRESASCHARFDDCQSQLASLRRLVNREILGLKNLIQDVVGQLDVIGNHGHDDNNDDDSSSHLKQNKQPPISSHKDTTATTTITASSSTTKVNTKKKKQQQQIPRAIQAKKPTTTTTTAPPYASQTTDRRIQEAISSTRRWHRDHKTTTLSEADFVARYLRQQSKRDPPMAVFIQRALRRRVVVVAGGGGGNNSRPPSSLDDFCRDVKWRDVIVTVERVLVKDPSAAAEALCR